MNHERFLVYWAATRNRMGSGLRQLRASNVAGKPFALRLAVPSQLHRRSIAALYAKQKAAVNFRRVSRRLLRLA